MGCSKVWSGVDGNISMNDFQATAWVALTWVGPDCVWTVEKRILIYGSHELIMDYSS